MSAHRARRLLIVAAIAVAQAAATFRLGAVERHVLGGDDAAYVALTAPPAGPAVVSRAKDAQSPAHAARCAANLPGTRPALDADVLLVSRVRAIAHVPRWLPRTPRPPPLA